MYQCPMLTSYCLTFLAHVLWTPRRLAGPCGTTCSRSTASPPPPSLHTLHHHHHCSELHSTGIGNTETSVWNTAPPPPLLHPSPHTLHHHHHCSELHSTGIGNTETSVWNTALPSTPHLTHSTTITVLSYTVQE